MQHESSDPVPAAAREAIAAGRLVDAIRIVRETTGLGLKEAKDLVDAQLRTGASATTAPTATATGVPIAAHVALNHGNRIEAIRLVRSAHGLGLKAAHDAVEAYLAAHPELPAARNHRSAGGWRWLALLVVAIVVVALWLADRS